MQPLKSLSNKKDLEMALELFNMIEMRKIWYKREREIKDHFKGVMKDDEINVLRLGDILLTLTDRATTHIDRKKLAEELGVDDAKRFEKETQYVVLDVKQIYG